MSHDIHGVTIDHAAAARLLTELEDPDGSGWGLGEDKHGMGMCGYNIWIHIWEKHETILHCWDILLNE